MGVARPTSPFQFHLWAEKPDDENCLIEVEKIVPGIGYTRPLATAIKHVAAG